ncbi:UTP--glucose-1-phosphate uridylyltransferase [Paenibacillus chitinolyticus]|uniref:UTP--glucose-1-phosphate uridylyltransferase n=1 Tax=Paenibacillus chitinolyticus TaxID=79263 RepID=A0A410WTN6_9BACL|nr:UTP--glucose-1-phosphate uridylyltransferase GalU [Paenibacillus chitinolyticus]MCY9593667.1 UTP--glucose-1-phosphate uridylyltransferase GalU [Paenibacillus chitinolyticus]MCY9597376.1 UTP--glucose-1-phosphate uridylyltransferase GalU [Paenibacillus chitinolyticus]QAV17759.1 UTP--glucose-1-phosphate uridylyltransferase [Paenibacillus chitinolyticus]
MTIKKAVIPAAGLGTRFLPATKAQPKEMLPIVDKPAIQYIVEEAVRSGIESIIIVTGRNKKSIEDHFDRSVELEQTLSEKGKMKLLQEVQAISEMAKIHFIRQKEPLGLGHAILCAKQFIGSEPFAVLLGDDIMVSDPPALRQMIHLYEETGRQVIGVKPVPDSEVDKYGIIDSAGGRNRIHRVAGLVEKPSLGSAPSNVAVMGRYVLEPTIFPILENIEKGASGEYQLTDALHEIAKREELLALELAGNRYDIGDKLGYLKAVLEIGLKREELASQLLPYLKNLVYQQEAEAWKLQRERRRA